MVMPDMRDMEEDNPEASPPACDVETDRSRSSGSRKRDRSCLTGLEDLDQNQMSDRAA